MFNPNFTQHDQGRARQAHNFSHHKISGVNRLQLAVAARAKACESPAVRRFQSHGDGRFERGDFLAIGDNVVFEEGVRVFHPETIRIGNNVYVGHDAFLKGYHKGSMTIGDDTWLGQGVFLHSAGGITIGARVGIGPFVKMLTSAHAEAGRSVAILDAPLEFAPIVVEDESDIGLGAILLPGVTVGRGAQVGAGAVVTRDVPAYAVAAGNPARVLRMRRG